MTEREWPRLESLIAPAKPGGRARGSNMRAAINAIFYLPRTFCPWRYLPRDKFPPRSAVDNIFRNFHKDGVREAIRQGLHMELREGMERAASSVAAIIDSRSLKPAEKEALTTV